ncbi:hypothetical protein RMN57_12085 [Kitasatospora sp. CM 4170]|uniref:Uncharacterized protein n=1 Tax=Kitasatospora aburaviensis TaxID=67265 RepID=A0ABW1ETR6_9ACTN|nr:hypothetical protein [Kitasatospora sp. CM 4170]WNM45402.1 hypothetical protein RMN57_12085 [Kitasatospora sp. CM 4170]
MDLTDLEPMPRQASGARGVRPRGRRTAAVAALVLAAAVAVAGCDGDGGKSAAESATRSSTASASTAASPTAPASPAAPSASAPVAPPSADPSVTAPDPRPANPTPGSVPPVPALTPTPAPTPPREGIAVGEPDPNGKPAVRPAITYRVDGNRLTVWFYGGVCERYALKADESKPGRVDVRVTLAAPVPAGQSCAELARRQTVAADLKQPLTGRTVFDASNGQAVPLETDAAAGPNPDGAGPDVAGR